MIRAYVALATWAGREPFATVPNSGSDPLVPVQWTITGRFQMQNPLTAQGDVDPHWNTPLGVVQVNDAVSSVTLIFNQLRGDGVGGNIGYFDPLITPTAPSTWGRLKTLYR
jgi:hypothetical protein